MDGQTLKSSEGITLYPATFLARHKKKILVSACELIRGVLVLQDVCYFSINMLWPLIRSTNKGKGIKY